MVKQSTRFAIIFLSIVIYGVSPAYAYLDPGTGTVILQGIIAVISGVVAFGYYYLNRVKQFLGLAPKTDHTDSGSQENPEKTHN